MKKFTLHRIHLLSTMGLLAITSAYADDTVTSSAIIVAQDFKHDVSPPLRDTPILSLTEMLSQPHTIQPLFLTPLTKEETTFVPDGALQTTPDLPLAIPVTHFIGVGVGLGNFRPSLTPPDPNGSVGLTQYVQWVNAAIGVFNKSTGTVVSGFPKAGNSIWKGFGGLCETTNRGDPMVKYDQLANRWVLSQFAFTSTSTGPFFQCIAVSTTPDATGTYNRYAFQFDSFNDYGKLGLWSDGYYMSFNMFGPVSKGPRACAFNKQAMLAGQPAQMQCRQLSWGTTGTLLPADLDGQMLPPTGNPEYFMSFSAPSTLKLFKFHVDFANPNNSTFTGPTNIAVASFSIAGKAPQPKTTTQLDTLSDRLMHRLAYRQFVDHASMVATHTVKGLAPALAPAIRWYELRFNPASTTPVVYQQATRAPDTVSRFMGSIAMDKVGDIAVGYTLSSTNDFPAVSFAARNSTDALNTLNLSQRIFTGSGSQTGISRWGDYSGMSIDPVDNCTFWYTNEYLPSTGSFNWSTRVGHFKLQGCS